MFCSNLLKKSVDLVAAKLEAHLAGLTSILQGLGEDVVKKLRFIPSIVYVDGH